MENYSFLGNDPGAVRFGNFINYYSFHPPEYRISSILDDIWKESNIVILDIGCNSGDLTQKLYEYLVNTKKKSTEIEEMSNISGQSEIHNCFIVGVDLDAVLITRAKEGNKYPSNIFYECLDIMTNEYDAKLLEILHNFKKSSFDSIFCFSVSMWIHLNHGDDGLSSFISKMCKWTNCVVIEPQPWKCYTSAVRRLKKAGGRFPFSPFTDLVLARSIDTNIDHIFQSECFMKIRETNPSNWHRKTLLYKKYEQ